MSFAARLKRPSLKLPLPQLGGVGAGLKKLRENRTAALLLWIAFLAGLVGADLWFSAQQPPVKPVAQLAIGPIAPPLIVGVDPLDRALAPAPRPDLVIATPEGNLPSVGANGDAPRLVYAYPFDREDARPHISVVLTEVGLQPNLLQEAVRRLPGSVALAYSPFTPELDKAITAARQAGHEVLLAIPTSTLSALDNPGPGALRPDLSVAENMQRLRLLMAQASGYTGLLFPLKTPITSDDTLMQALFAESRVRGLQLLTDQPDFVALGLSELAPTAVISAAIDEVLDPSAIDQALANIEQRARETGHVVVTTALYPFLIGKLADWLPTLSGKGLALAPVSAASPLLPPSAPAATDTATPATADPAPVDPAPHAAAPH